LVGPPGTGKTTTALAIAHSTGWEVLEMNASDLRNRKNIEGTAGLASVSTTFSGNKRLILLDEVDGMFKADFGGSNAVLQVVKGSQNPVILTANDAYASTLTTIRSYCDVVKFKKIHYGTIKTRLAQICEKEGVKCDDDTLTELAKREAGDLKAAINDLQAVAEGAKLVDMESIKVLGARDRSERIFDSLMVVFKKKNIRDAKEAFDACEEDPEMFMNWVDENIPLDHEGQGLADAFESLSRADIYAGRIAKRQDWGLMKYQLDFMTGGVSLAESKPGYSMYQFPSFIRKLSASKAARNARNSMADKVGKRIHASRREVVQEYWPFFLELFRKDPQGFAALFGLDDKELEFLGAKPETVREARGKPKRGV